MKLNIQKKIARILAWSLLLQAFSPVALFADQTKICCTKPIKPCKPKHKKKKHYDADYIIIGMGTAGAVIANRLTNDKKTSVIGLEAGDNNNNDEVIEVPASGYLNLLPNYYPYYFWQGEQVIQPQMDNRSFQWTAGRLLGGSSSINGMIVVRGSNTYWSNMADLLGPDWSLDKTLARYKKLETFIAPFVASPARGTNGPWTNVALAFTPTEDNHYLANAMAAASNSPIIDDYNDPTTPIGTSLRSDNQVRPVGDIFLRESTAFAFLNSDVMTPNGFGVNGRKLRVHLRATAIDLLWNKKNKVIGVRYTQDGECHEIFARKEVIVSAGFQSAQFLQRNGIGPKDILNAAGVPVRVENDNVGFFYNHTIPFALFSIPGAVLVPPTEPWALYSATAFLPSITPIVGDPQSAPREMQWVTVQLAPDLMLLGPAHLNPVSVGTIAIQNDDPFKIPLVSGNYFGDTEGPGGTSADLATCVQAFQNFVADLTEYFSNNPAPNGQTWTLLQPSLDVINDTAALENYLLATTFQSHHYTSSTPAGLTPDVAAVDPHGRVFGTKGLRVADNSILPYVPDGNTGTPAVLVGWAISDFILAGE
ncbi:MAG: GMC family oxidoreductase [Candidatus Babeliales bacterium]